MHLVTNSVDSGTPPSCFKGEHSISDQDLVRGSETRQDALESAIHKPLGLVVRIQQRHARGQMGIPRSTRRLPGDNSALRKERV